MTYVFELDAMNISAMNRFVHFFSTEVSAIRFSLGGREPATRCLSEWMRVFVERRMAADTELNFNHSVPDYFGLSAQAYWQLAMSCGLTYKIKPSGFDALDSRVRKEIGVQLLRKLMVVGTVDWYTPIRDVVGLSRLEQVVEWHGGRALGVGRGMIPTGQNPGFGAQPAGVRQIR